MTDKVLTQAKRLPRKEGGDLEDTFIANGNTYKWLDITLIGIEAWTGLTNLMDVFYSGKDSFQAVHDYHLETAVQAGGFTGINELKHFISTRLQNYLDGVVNKSQQRFHLSMHIAATLTLRKGDDIRGYSHERSEDYISDWVKEGYSHIDFFTIAGSLSEEFRLNFRQTQQRILDLSKLSRGVSAENSKAKTT